MKLRHPLLKILTVNTLILTIGILILELAFGGWLDPKRLNRLNLIKDRTLTYNVSKLYTDLNPSITYSRDEYGRRGQHSTPSEIDILTVGGSTTDQRYIRDGETWRDVLQQQFAQTGRTAIVANAGVDGQSTFGHIKNFAWWFPDIPDLAPNYILFYVGLNDFHKDAGDSYDRLVKDTRSFDLGQAIKKHSALWHLGRTIHGTFRAVVVKRIVHRSTNFEELAWTQEALQQDYDFLQPRLSGYESRLYTLADMTHKLGAKPIIVSQPSRQYRVTADGILGWNGVRSYEGRQINGVDYYYMMQRIDRVTKAVSHEQGAIFIDLASHPDWVDADFYDFSHMTPQGAEKVGRLLFQALQNSVKRQ